MAVVNDLLFEVRKDPVPKWCKRCVRKHSANKPCDLVKIKDLTAPEGRPVGHYRVRLSEEA